MISARTLAPRERVQFFGSGNNTPRAPDAEERWSWWQRTYFDRNESAWSHWLDTWTRGGDGLSVVEIDSARPPPSGYQMDWLRFLHDVRQTAEHQARSEAATSRAPLSAIASVIRPFLDHVDLQLTSALPARGLSPAEEMLFRSGALDWLASRLRATAAPSTAVAVNVHRLANEASLGDAVERARQFERLVRCWPSRQASLQATPVLDRLLAQICMDSIDACLECATHFAADRTALREKFGVERLERVAFGLGDPHRQGRTVVHFSFNIGGGVVYKPRPMDADLAFNGLISWLATHLSDAPEPVLTLGCGDHGWARFVEASDCADEAEIARAYRRTGILLGAFDLCAGSDLHFENVIYEGANPVIVDLETLLCPTVIQSEETATLFYRARIEAILRTGYLPGGAVVNGFRRDFSASALHSTLETPFQEQIYLDDDGDSLAVRLKPFLMQPRENCARIGARRIPVADHVQELAEGIEAAYRLFAEYADELLQADGPLAPFRDIEVRWVPRGTTVYGQALRSSLHPAHMRDGIDHELAWAELAIWSPGGRQRKDILEAEICDLWRCDIPLFTTTATSTHAWSACGVQLPDVFLESGWDALCRRVRALKQSASDRSARGALCAFEAIVARPRPHPSEPAEAGDSLPLSTLLDEAARIGQRLLDDSFNVDGHLFWVTPQSLSKDEYCAGITEFDLYAGGGGIGLFFYELGAATGCRDFVRAAEACRTSMRFSSETTRLRLGAFNGLGGALYAEMRLAGGPENIEVDWTARCLGRLRNLLEDDRTYDVIGGASGIILVLRHLARHPQLGDAACGTIEQCAKLLEAASFNDDGAACWHSSGLATPSGGFAHGTAGHAAALTVAAACLGLSEWDDLILRAVAYTKRSAGGGSWCHGDVGRLTAMDIITLHRPDLAKQAAPPVSDWCRTREMSLHGGNDSVCHGILGNLDGLIDGVGADRALALRAASNALRRGRTTGWLPSVSNVNPGLMLGHAGIGYQLLRARDPSIASVLRLDIST